MTYIERLHLCKAMFEMNCKDLSHIQRMLIKKDLSLIQQKEKVYVFC